MENTAAPLRIILVKWRVHLDATSSPEYSVESAGPRHTKLTGQTKIKWVGITKTIFL